MNIPTRISYPVDAEHGALRMAVVIIFIAILIVSYIVLNLIIPNDGINLIAVIGGFVITALFTQQIEKVMRQRWPSGRTLQIDAEQVSLAAGDNVQEMIDTSKQVNVLLWRFQIKRRSRVPKGWYMVACALEQDETHLPVYTFFSPEECEQLDIDRHFTLLSGKKEHVEKSGPGRTDLRLAGEQRRLHTAENLRWMSGAEMTSEDFKAYLKQLQERFPQWMPSVL